MATYPGLPKYYNITTLSELMNVLNTYTNELTRELDLRDRQQDNLPSTKIYTVVTITDIGRPRKGDIAYAASAGKFKGYVSTTATQAWENLN